VGGITVSILLGPGTDAPEVTPVTATVGLLLLVFEYLYVREVVKRKGRPLTISWVITTLIVLGVLAIAEVTIILIASFLWAITLPILVIYILVLSYILLVKAMDKAR
jgi:hypothetical protein